MGGVGDSGLTVAAPVGDGEPVSAEAIATVGVGLAVLLPLILTLHGRVFAEVARPARRCGRRAPATCIPWRSAVCPHRGCVDRHRGPTNEAPRRRPPPSDLPRR